MNIHWIHIAFLVFPSLAIGKNECFRSTSVLLIFIVCFIFLKIRQVFGKTKILQCARGILSDNSLKQVLYAVKVYLKLLFRFRYIHKINTFLQQTVPAYIEDMILLLMNKERKQDNFLINA